MIYLLNGDIYLIKNYLNELIKGKNIDEINISRYDMDSYNYKDIIEDIESISLFEENKMVIIYNASIFTSAKTAIPLEPFEKYLEEPNSNTCVIFITEDKLDERKKVTKLLRKIGIVKDFVKKDNDNVIKDMLDNYKMDDNALAKFKSLVGDDYFSFLNEIEKLKLYKGNDTIISEEDVLKVTTNNVEPDLFKLMDDIMSSNKDGALKRLDDMLKYGAEPMQIIIALANKYRLLYQVKSLVKKGYGESEIASILKQNPKYIYVLNKISRSYQSNSLLAELENLANLDYSIKSGNIDPKLSLELYILKK